MMTQPTKDALSLLDEPPLGEGCPSHFALDRLESGEVQGVMDLGAWPEVEGERAQGAARFQALMSKEAFLEAMAQGQGENIRRSPPAEGLWTRLGRWLGDLGLVPVALAVACAALVLVPLLDDGRSSGTRLKGMGEDVPLTILRLEEGGVHALVEGDRPREGDRIQFLVRSQGFDYAMVINLDDQGRFSAYFPDGAGESIPLDGPSPHILDGAIELDDFRGKESIILLLSEVPLGVEGVRDAAEAWALAQSLEGELLPVEDVDLLPYLDDDVDLLQHHICLEKE